MRITDPFIIPPDVQLLPVAELDPDLRVRLAAPDRDYAIARPRARIPAKIVDAATATLLREFMTPTTIVDAVLRASGTLNEDAEELLQAAYPLLHRFIKGGLLVTVDDLETAKIAARHRAGDQVCGYTIRACLHVLQDTELYTVRDASGQPAVLKLARVDANTTLGDFDREARVLARLDGSVAPRLIESGRVDDRPYLVLEWCPGINLEQAAAELRRAVTADALTRLASLVGNLVDAYARLHAHGVVHGDVHEGNVLVDRVGRVSLVDFGHARIVDDGLPGRASRGGYGLYFEPEFASAQLEGKRHPAASLKSDQYALAAMIYSLLTGSTYLDFAMEEARALRQIATETPLPFVQRGIRPWPAVEQVLARALAKDPNDRYPNTVEFSAELREGLATRASEQLVPQLQSGARDNARELCSRVLDRVSFDSDLSSGSLLSPPTASVTYGAAGVAYGLYRLSLLRNDPALLSLADLWSARALRERRKDRAFYDGEALTKASFARRTFHYGAVGLDVVRALIAHAMGDFVTMREAVRALATLPGAASDPLDLALGTPGVLVGVSLVLEAVPESGLVAPAPLWRAGERCANAVISALSPLPPIEEEQTFVNLGMAHGWAGAVYSLLRWYQVTGRPCPDVVKRRLDELAKVAEPTGRGVRWPWRQRREDGSLVDGYMSGWCNGSAGFVHLWLAAAASLDEPSYRGLAEAAAWDAWEDPDDTARDLCCGLAGRAYALLALYRSNGNEEWLQRAHSLADDAVTLVTDEEEEPSPSLYKGDLGLTILLQELEEPHLGRMPLFESESWPRRHGETTWRSS